MFLMRPSGNGFERDIHESDMPQSDVALWEESLQFHIDHLQRVSSRKVQRGFARVLARVEHPSDHTFKLQTFAKIDSSLAGGLGAWSISQRWGRFDWNVLPRRAYSVRSCGCG